LGDGRNGTQYAFRIKGFGAGPHMVCSEHGPVDPGCEICRRFQVRRADAWYRDKVHYEIVSDQYDPENPVPGFLVGFYKDNGTNKKDDRNSWQYSEDPKMMEIKILKEVQNYEKGIDRNRSPGRPSYERPVVGWFHLPAAHGIYYGNPNDKNKERKYQICRRAAIPN
jgi:hypothetical protein